MSTKAPENNDNNTSSEAQHTNRRKRLIGSIAALAITVGGGAIAFKEQSGPDENRQQYSRTDQKTPTAKPTKAPQAVETNTGPKTIEQLPGFGEKVTAQERAILRASTVKIAERVKGQPDAPWMGNCTGLKVSIGGENYVATSRHCFVEPENLDNQLKYFPSLNTGVDRASAADLNQTKDITKSISSEVGIWTINVDGMQDDLHTAPVSNVSVRYYPDVALLKVNEASSASTAFDALPAVPYEDALKKEAIPGAEVALFSLPAIGGGSLLESTGMYLGRVNDPDDPTRKIDLVGVNPSSPAEDGCNFGASGSVAVIAGGIMTGPLSSRNNITNPLGTNEEDDSAFEQPKRDNMENQLNGLDLSGFATVCEFSVLPVDTAQNMAQSVS